MQWTMKKIVAVAVSLALLVKSVSELALDLRVAGGAPRAAR